MEAFVLNVEDEEVKTDIQNVGASSNGTPTSAPTNLGTWLGSTTRRARGVCVCTSTSDRATPQTLELMRRGGESHRAFSC